jgi:hypothetical protein
LNIVRILISELNKLKDKIFEFEYFSNISKSYIISCCYKNQLIFYNWISKNFVRKYCNILYRMIICFINKVTMYYFVRLWISQKNKISLVRSDPEIWFNLIWTWPRSHFGCTWPQIYIRWVGRVLNSRPGSGSGCPPGRQELGLACLPTRYTHKLARVSPWILDIR